MLSIVLFLMVMLLTAPTSDAAEVADTLKVDVERSVIQWRGTKFWGTRKHSGIVRLAEGSIVIHGNEIAAGRFVIDMTTIEVTDIPKSDPIPRNRLRRHLLDEDFFFVQRYPTAVLQLGETLSDSDGSFVITGNMTIRGVSRQITFEAHIPVLRPDALRATAQITLNRHRWGVSFRGSRLTNDLVDDKIYLDLLLGADASDPS